MNWFTNQIEHFAVELWKPFRDSEGSFAQKFPEDVNGQKWYKIKELIPYTIEVYNPEPTQVVAGFYNDEPHCGQHDGACRLNVSFRPYVYRLSRGRPHVHEWQDLSWDSAIQFSENITELEFLFSRRECEVQRKLTVHNSIDEWTMYFKTT